MVILSITAARQILYIVVIIYTYHNMYIGFPHVKGENEIKYVIFKGDVYSLRILLSDGEFSWIKYCFQTQACSIQISGIEQHRVGGGIAPAVLRHYRANGSVHGGSRQHVPLLISIPDVLSLTTLKPLSITSLNSLGFFRTSRIISTIIPIDKNNRDSSESSRESRLTHL